MKLSTAFFSSQYTFPSPLHFLPIPIKKNSIKWKKRKENQGSSKCNCSVLWFLLNSNPRKFKWVKFYSRTVNKIIRLKYFLSRVVFVFIPPFQLTFSFHPLDYFLRQDVLTWPEYEFVCERKRKVWLILE